MAYACMWVMAYPTDSLYIAIIPASYSLRSFQTDDLLTAQAYAGRNLHNGKCC